jgi:DUF2075 family protein
MIIYQAIKSEFQKDVNDRDIESVVLDKFKFRTGHKVSISELQSWKNSLGFMGKVLSDNDIPDDCGIAIEYGLPQTSKRVDFIITGRDAANLDHAIIIELKQWESAGKTDKDGIVTTRFANGEREVNHPSYQAWSYAAILNDFNEAVETDKIQLRPCAYLHNYIDDGIINDAFYAEYLNSAPVFLKGEHEREKLRSFIKQHVKYGDSSEIMYKIEGGKIRPSKSLADRLSSMMKGNNEFVLLDDQKLVYEAALSLAGKSSEKKKNVFIVEGGPGTGKSIVAINLLVELTRREQITKYVTKNAAPRAVYENRLTGSYKKSIISNFFSSSGSFTKTKNNFFDTLIVDEAHRLNAKTGMFKKGENQIKEIINSAKCAIFFIDESQKVTWDDIGTIDEIGKWAKAGNAKIHFGELESQFRCSGSDGYIAWLDNTLGIKPTANEMLGHGEFDFRVFDSPEELRKVIVHKNKQANKARMVAGYCWKWKSKKNPTAYDIEFENFGFQMRWNLVQDGSLWIQNPNSVNEIGCIHTCQGLEVDYIGVVIGDDFIVRNSEVVTQPLKRDSRDKSMQGFKKLFKADPQAASAKADLIIKNTYRTLLSRGMRGCYIYCTDPETAEYFRQRIVLAPSAKAESIEAIANDIASAEVFPFKKLSRSEITSSIDAIPLLDLKIAAGSFGAFQHLDEDSNEWIELPEGFKYSADLFVAKVSGESMNNRIPNGSWCLFKANPTGTKQGKIVVAQLRSHLDPETGGSYTLKIYSSQNTFDAEGEFQHSITLSPASTDKSYLPIDVVAGDEVLIVAELVAVI